MDVTTVPCGRSTRDALAEYRDQQGYSNYNEALRDLLKSVSED